MSIYIILYSREYIYGLIIIAMMAGAAVNGADILSGGKRDDIHTKRREKGKVTGPHGARGGSERLWL